ncbi:NTP transferase domain-containing protein [bacterium]|nr:NTP transferase domain-containing protein [bacterium]
MYPIAILAGGLATRLRPITEKIPKALVEIAGEPFIFHQLRYLKGQNIQRIILCVGYLGEMIQSVVGNGMLFDLEVVYSFDGNKLLGTGGALKHALPWLGDSFFVLYGDSFLPIDFVDVQSAYLRSGADCLMTVIKNADKWDKSNVVYKDGRILEYNKHKSHKDMKYIDYGLGILSASIFETYDEHHTFDLAEIYESRSNNGGLAGYEVFKRFYEIGSPDGIRETEEYLSKNKWR